MRIISSKIERFNYFFTKYCLVNGAHISDSISTYVDKQDFCGMHWVTFLQLFTCKDITNVRTFCKR